MLIHFGGYKLFHMANPGAVAEGITTTSADHAVGGASSSNVVATAPAATSVDSIRLECPAFLRRHEASETSTKPYKSLFTSVAFVPFLRIDNYNPTARRLTSSSRECTFFPTRCLTRLVLLASL